jgi:hypothetical protein
MTWFMAPMAMKRRYMIVLMKRRKVACHDYISVPGVCCAFPKPTENFGESE